MQLCIASAAPKLYHRHHFRLILSIALPNLHWAFLQLSAKSWSCPALSLFFRKPTCNIGSCCKSLFIIFWCAVRIFSADGGLPADV